MTPTTFLSIVAWVTGIFIALALFLVLYRASTTHNDARRAVHSDMVIMAMVALFLVYSLNNRTSITYEVVLFLSLFGSLSTVAFARIITRGRR